MTVTRAILGTLGVALLVGAAWMGILVSDRMAPVTDAVVTIVPQTVVQGEAIQVNVAVFYRASCSTYIRRNLYDSHGQRYAVPELDLPPGEVGMQHSSGQITVAPDFAIGEGRYVSNPSYGCNWFQRHFWPVRMPDRSEGFTVVPRPAGGGQTP